MTDLERAVSALIRMGHANAWDYPHGVFMASLEELEESLSGNPRPGT